MSTIVVMPGGFHPFHAGHAALYNSARRAFPGADVYVAATNDTSTRPFPFAIKEKLAKLAGVAPGHFVQVKSPFRAREITDKFNPEQDKLIFVRSQKDATKPPEPGRFKKDGTPGYLQPLLGAKKLEPFGQHAYMAYLPTVEFGPGMTSATEIRTAWPTLDEKRKTALVMSLYPKTQTNPRLAATVVKMLDTAMSTELNEFAPPGSNDGGDDGFSEETLKMLAAQWYNGNEDPRVERTLMAAGWEIGQDEGYDDEPGVFVVQAGDINGNSYLSWPAHELKQGVAEAQLDESGNEYILYINSKPAAKYTDIRQAEQDLYLVKSKVPTAKFEIKKEVCNMVPVPVGLKEALLKEFAQGMAETLAGTSPQGFVGGMYANYQARENQPVDEDYIEEKWSQKYKRSINCSNPRGFSQRAHCAGRKK